MQRRLIVLRHAKSAWNTDAPSDHERPLNSRGRRDAPRIGEALSERGWVPEYVLSSDSKRTRETWKRMKTAFDGVKKVTFTRDLYHAGIDEVVQLGRKIEAEVATAMVIGHNPGWEEVVQALTGDGPRMTTCNAAMLVVEADTWKGALSESDWTLVELLRPKEL
jgi:phosphohistidine phosphatase